MKRIWQLATTALLLAMAAPGSATIVFSNNFDTENGGVGARNYHGFAGLSVSYPSVDLVFTGDGSGIACAGGAGGCVDLDGGEAGQLISQTYGFTAGQAVTLSFAISGSQRTGSPLDETYFAFRFDQPTAGTFAFRSSSGNSLTDIFAISDVDIAAGFADLGLLGGSEFNSGFFDVAFSFVPLRDGTFRFLFDEYTFGPDDGDDAGRILDDVTLDISAAVPEPATWAFMLLGFGLLGATLRQRRDLSPSRADVRLRRLSGWKTALTMDQA